MIPETTGTSRNRSGTVTVRATDQGLPLQIAVERDELRRGARALADEILQVTRQAAIEARTRRRAELSRAGVPDDVLDRLGLPTATTTQPTATWMRPV